MANAPQMKIPIGADTQDFEKGAKKVKQEMHDLNKVGTDAFAAIGNALGVDTGKIQQFSSALQGAGTKLQQMGGEGTKAFGSILKSIAPVAAGIAGLGIAGAVAAFKSLNSEAEAFKETVAGANIELATQAYVNTYRQAVRDMEGDVGKAVAETQSRWQKFWQTLGANIKIAIRTGAGASVYGQSAPGANEQFVEDTKKAADLASQAEKYTNEIYKLERQRKEQAVEIAQIDNAIADQLAIARDTQASIADRQKAVAEVENLIATKKQKVVTLEQDITKLYEDRAGLATNTVEETDALLTQQARQYQAERAITVESNSLLRLKGQIARQSGAAAQAAAIEAEARKREAEALAEEQARLKAIADEEERMIKLVVTNNIQSIIGSAKATTSTSSKVGISTELLAPDNLRVWRADILEELGGGISVMVSIDPDSVQKIQDISKDLESIAQNFAVNVGEAIGTLFADLTTGQNAWGNFANAAISAFADMAIAIGKIAIETGLASEGIKAALHLDNPYIAIAAGVALVALGTAVKAGLSNIANGNYSASAGMASSTQSSSLGGYETREIKVNVTGTLVGEGSSLIGVINTTNQKMEHTT